MNFRKLCVSYSVSDVKTSKHFVQNEIVANVKKEEELPETEAAKKLVGKVISGEDKKEENGFDQGISSQV